MGGEELLEARRANMMAYSALALACEGAALGLVEGSVTAELPNRLEMHVWPGKTFAVITSQRPGCRWCH